jgi:hypothetical protein
MVIELSPSRTLIRLICMALLIPAAARGQDTLFVRDAFVEGMRVHRDQVYWKAGCGDDFTPAQSRVQVVSTSAPSPSTGRVLYAPPACGGDRVASKNIAVDEDYVYWITGDRRVVRLPLGSVSGAAETLYDAGAANASGYYIAVSGNDVLWSNGTTVTRAARAGRSRPEIVVDAGRGMRDVHELTAAGENRYFFLDGRQLYATSSADGGSSFVTLPMAAPSDTVAFAVRGNEVVTATGARGAYTIYSFPVDNSAPQRSLYTAPAGAPPDHHVDQIALDDTNIYVHVAGGVAGGPILRLPRTFPVPGPISEDILMRPNDRMHSNGVFLFWVEGDGIHRLPLGATASSSLTHDVAPFTMTDISPDRPYGSPGTDYAPYGADPAGMVVSVAVDPNNAQVVYAASERAGVWKSTDGAVSWRQSSAGLRNGSSTGAMSIAIDARNSQRLLYASANDDSRPGHDFGGLYRSLDGGGSWEHVPLPGCHPNPSLWKVAFGAGRGYALTICGIFWSDDLRVWTQAPRPPTTDPVATFAVRGRTVFVCYDNRVFRSIDGAGSWQTASLTVPRRCDEMSEAPTDVEPEAAALVVWHNTRTFEVALLDFRDGTVRDLGYANVPRGNSGQPLVFAARRRGTSLAVPSADAAFDVFASNHDLFFQLTTGGWTPIEPVHWDTRGMAFPANYDPSGGSCRAYVATDGGVFASNASTSSGAPCVTASGPWVRSQSGLHAFHSFQVGGVPPLLFLSSGHNGTWVSTTGGVPGTSWQLADRYCCGDSGMVLVDPAVPRMMTGRNDHRVVYDISPGLAWPHSGTNIYIPETLDGAAPPSQATTTQIMTVPGEPSPAHGDYVAAVTPPAEIGSGHQFIMRNQTDVASGWRPLSGGYFRERSVVRVAASGGHANPTVYALTTDGQIHAGRVDDSGSIRSWSVISAGLSGPRNLYVNPYAPGILFVTDGDGTIKFTTDGGLRWNPAPEMTRIASRNGEFRIGCTDWFCSLQDLLFVPSHPRMIIAVLWPGGIAVSPDAGANWVPITERIVGTGSLSSIPSFGDLLARPYSALFDPSGAPGGEGVLYVALRGRGIIRIDGPFSRLERRRF